MRAAFSILFIAITLFAFGQEKEKKSSGRLSGQWRSYYLGTINDGDLKDFHAIATGGKLKYVHGFGEHWRLGGAMYVSINTGIQDLTVPDQATGRVSRYESGLFDVQNLDDQFIAFPGELFVQYLHGEHEITLGRMKIKSPFINPEDGRMIPTLEQGLWYKYQPNKWKLQAGLFNQIAPRSTSGFFDIGESIGKYPVGRHTDGSRSQYASNTISDFVAVLNVDYSVSDQLKLEMWDYWVDNVFHSFYLKPTWKLSENTSLSGEWLHQDRVGDGGNAIDSLRYFVDRSSNILGIQVSQKVGKGKFSLGYDHILKGGRFIFPREWGREFLFSFQKRERSEGAANNHALVAYYDQTFGKDKNKWRGIFSVSHHWKPDVTNAEDNKYAQPNYMHVNLDIFWMPQNIKGLRPELLLTYKKGTGDFPDNPNFILNKVDMFQVNFVVNYNF